MNPSSAMVRASAGLTGGAAADADVPAPHSSADVASSMPHRW